LKNASSETLKLLEDKGKKLLNTGIHSGLLDMTIKAQTTKSKINKQG
jgi:hypothetical protein